MRIAVCDDEKEIRESMGRCIRLACPEAELVDFADGEALMAYQEKLDILFLDIQMEGTDGMEAARRLRRTGSDVTIIFVTAIEEYVFSAFDVGAFHYLVKPFEKARFFEVLQRAVKERQKQREHPSAEEPGIVVKTGTQSQKVFLWEIRYLEVFNSKVTLNKTDGSLEFYGKLSELEKRLGADFVRCHRAYIVNLRYVQRYDTGNITLDDGTTILLAKQKYADFVRRYMDYIRRLGGCNV